LVAPSSPTEDDRNDQRTISQNGLVPPTKTVVEDADDA